MLCEYLFIWLLIVGSYKSLCNYVILKTDKLRLGDGEGVVTIDTRTQVF